MTHFYQKRLHSLTLVLRIHACALLIFLLGKSFFDFFVRSFYKSLLGVSSCQIKSHFLVFHLGKPIMASLFKLLTGALEFIYYTSDNSPAQLGAYNLSTKTFSTVVTFGEYGSLFGDNIDYDADTNVLYTSTELLADGNPMTSGRLLSWDQKKVAAINSTFCWAIHSNVIAGDILCLTEWPFYNFSSSSSSSSSSLSLSLKNLHTTRRSRAKSLIREALMNQLPLSIVSKKHALMTSNTAPLQQMQFIVSINPTSGSTSLVKRDWSDEDVPTNNC